MAVFDAPRPALRVSLEQRCGSPVQVRSRPGGRSRAAVPGRVLQAVRGGHGPAVVHDQRWPAVST